MKKSKKVKKYSSQTLLFTWFLLYFQVFFLLLISQIV